MEDKYGNYIVQKSLSSTYITSSIKIKYLYFVALNLQLIEKKHIKLKWIKIVKETMNSFINNLKNSLLVEITKLIYQADISTNEIQVPVNVNAFNNTNSNNLESINNIINNNYQMTNRNLSSFNKTLSNDYEKNYQQSGNQLFHNSNHVNALNKNIFPNTLQNQTIYNPYISNYLNNSVYPNNNVNQSQNIIHYNVSNNYQYNNFNSLYNNQNLYLDLRNQEIAKNIPNQPSNSNKKGNVNKKK